MCGIYGIYRSSGGLAARDLIEPRDRLMHRGPDDAGVWLASDGRVGLAHRRLAIVELSALGHQPMSYGSGRYTIVFNGEIYNYRELRLILEQEGMSFAGGSDTEVLLAAYTRWGEDCLTRLNGMFAFVLHDRGGADTPPSLFMARDRAGKKPLYYLHGGGECRFASELKALSPLSGLSLSALNYYLAMGYVPAAHCIAEGVRKLPPAHCARLDLRSGQLTVRRYWALPLQSAAREGSETEGEALADETWRLLVDATRLRLHADVPVGVLLSGGFDSSLITAAAAACSSGRIKTFTVTLPGSSLDEASRAEAVARNFDTEHHVLPLDASGLAALEDIALLTDEPLADSSLLPTYLVSRLTRQHVTVALGGDGGDELFGGYGDYPQSLEDQRRYGWMPRALFGMAARLADRLPAGVRGRNRVASLRCGPLQQLIWGTPYFDEALRHRMLTREARETLAGESMAPEEFQLSLYQQGRSPVDAMTRVHFGSILPDDFLVKVDRASMMVALEMRSPFLDHRLVEFAFARIPDLWKVSPAGTRRIQRLLARRFLPSSFDHAGKQGFSVPLDQWLRQASRRFHDGWIERLPHVIDRDAASRLLTGLYAGRANGSRIFALIMLGYAAQNLRLS